ncbi:hypothetical protein TNCV_5019031 [Trichonephila clavipes]|nr:hypothetical protein TNCV_5019031 [Trichonephila clavipes]
MVSDSKIYICGIKNSKITGKIHYPCGHDSQMDSHLIRASRYFHLSLEFLITNEQHRDLHFSSFTCGTYYEEIPTTAANDLPSSYAVLLYSRTCPSIYTAQPN